MIKRSTLPWKTDWFLLEGTEASPVASHTLLKTKQDLENTHLCTNVCEWVTGMWLSKMWTLAVLWINMFPKSKVCLVCELRPRLWICSCSCDNPSFIAPTATEILSYLKVSAAERCTPGAVALWPGKAERLKLQINVCVSANSNYIRLQMFCLFLQTLENVSSMEIKLLFGLKNC